MLSCQEYLKEGKFKGICTEQKLNEMKRWKKTQMSVNKERINKMHLNASDGLLSSLKKGSSDTCYSMDEC